ncbi:MAG TPA: T9SS type A sorting domain-containing protein [Balneolaceae bacterium]|nr:T9SS type A sorting domain-containing protein [Balneolaceae bacterium]
MSFGKYSYGIFTDGSGDITKVHNQYWGTDSVETIKNNIIYDFWDDPELPMVEIEPKLDQPSDSAHGVVWKVLVNNQDPRKKTANPVGVGPVRYDVYFNRPMDTSYDPQLTFGVRRPYTQNAVVDSAHWSSDSTHWTAYTTVDLTTGDGINRIRVDDAKDPEGFKIPVEDQRFEFLIDAAGTESQDFMAHAGLGEINLGWKPPKSVSDLLGYNIYRYQNKTDSTYSDTVRINNELVTDTTYTDYKVKPDSNYYYQYTVVRTNLDESGKSKVAAAQALTSDPGDANGDLKVNVLDLTTTVAYIMDQHPEPFIFEAADVNSDSSINILDVVATVDLILKAKSTSPALTSGENNKANLIFNKGRLTLETPFKVGGMQFSFADTSKQNSFKALKALDGFEVAHVKHHDTLTVLAYSMNGETLAPGKYDLLQVDSTGVKMDDAILSTPNGSEITFTGLGKKRRELPAQYKLAHNYPNPFNPRTTINYELPEASEVTLEIYNILGRRVATLVDKRQKAGRYTIQFRADYLASGVYLYRLKAGDFTKVRKMILIK